MTEFKVGDRVKVEFEGTVESVGAKSVLVSRNGNVDSWVPKENATKIAPELPTKIGTVIDSHGYRFILTTRGWQATTDKNPSSVRDFGESMYAQDFIVVLEGN